MLARVARVAQVAIALLSKLDENGAAVSRWNRSFSGVGKHGKTRDRSFDLIRLHLFRNAAIVRGCCDR